MNDVDKFIKTIDPKLGSLVAKVRSIVKGTLPEADKKIKWGNPTYILKGKNLANIFVYRNHVDFGFFQGSKLKSSLLEGTGKGLRHIKIRSQEDIKEEEFIKLLKAAEIHS